jgi:hypothetical protein
MADTAPVQKNAAAAVAPPIAANCISVCPPTKDMLRPGAFSVNSLDKMEAITQPLYSYQSYPAAGANTLTFFQTQVGGATTLEDTNMQLQGQLPAPQKFLIQGVAIDYIPGIAPAELGADNVTSQVNDMYAIMRRGTMTITIGSKDYGTIAPLKFAPPRSNIRADLAVASQTTPAAGLQTLITLAYVDGDVWKPTPLLLEAGQNFKATITFPGGAVPIPSSDAAARIGVVFYGTLYRPPQ